MSTNTSTSPSGSLATILQSAPVDATTGINTKEDLRNHLLQAAAVEMQTIPMYLYAMYSISSKGVSRWDPGIGAQRLIRSIVVEEMLHLCLVRNILVAIGEGDGVRFYDENFVPDYPEYMLHRHPPLLLRLGRCDKDLVRDVFMEFERPFAKPSEGKPPAGQYATIGLFYNAIMKGIKKLDDQLGPRLWAANKPELQYVTAYWNKDGGGEPLAVVDRKTALAALSMIKDQGEGVDPKRPSVPIDPLNPKPGLDELPHYTKFQRIAEGIEPFPSVWAVPTDPKAFEYTDDAAATAINDLFNAAYCYVLHLIDVLYDTSGKTVRPGVRSPRYGLERTFISAMQGLLANLAELMVSRTLRSGPLANDNQIGPTFEYVALPETGKTKHLLELCDKAMLHFPQLGGDNSVRWLLNHWVTNKMPDV